MCNILKSILLYYNRKSIYKNISTELGRNHKHKHRIVFKTFENRVLKKYKFMLLIFIFSLNRVVKQQNNSVTFS